MNKPLKFTFLFLHIMALFGFYILFKDVENTTTSKHMLNCLVTIYNAGFLLIVYMLKQIVKRENDI